MYRNITSQAEWQTWITYQFKQQKEAFSEGTDMCKKITEKEKTI